jgi:cytochrome b6-f complex iron-sulfur subunit
MTDMPTRRTFCARAGLAAPGLVVALWPACARAAGLGQPGNTSPIPTIRGEAVDSRIRVTITSTPLASVGGIARIVSNGGSVLVARTAPQTFVALSATCSHEACLITDLDRDVYVCPCHGSRFDSGGNVLTGPAELPLYPLAATCADDVLTIVL